MKLKILGFAVRCTAPTCVTHYALHTPTPSLREGTGSRAGGVDISELTWEQKEQCLRLLFAKMNRRKTASSAKALQGQTATQALPAPPTQPQHADSAHHTPPTRYRSATTPVFMTEQLRGEGEVGVASELVQTAVEQVT